MSQHRDADPPGGLFGLHNLPYGVYSVPGSAPRVGVRLGEQVLDVATLTGDEATFARPSLNAFMAQGYDRWVAVRGQLTETLRSGVPDAAAHGLGDVRLHLPVEVADYVDFYASEHHARTVGQIFRPDAADPLTPNWRHLPVGYHGRAGSIVVSGTDIVRPAGQRSTPADPAPVFGPSVRLDLEVELGFVLGVPSPMGTRVAAADADRHIFGVVLFNDWSARDIQAWEYVPLGPHLGKSFASTVSPWVVPLLALQAARIPLPAQRPQVLPYLGAAAPWGLDVELSLEWNGEVISRPPYSAMYWSPAQMLAHLTVNGAPTRTGDLFASGTVSGPGRGERGSLIELTWNGAEPLRIGGRPSSYLQDGDEVVIRGTAPGPDGTRIGFGEARGRILPAP